MFFRIFQHLLPNARAWQTAIDKQLRQFFEGLSGTGSDLKLFIDQVWLDIFPETTRELDAWEAQFGLLGTLTDEQERRDRLAATWKALGGQDPRYIEDTLRDAGFDVYVHEWWQLPVVGSPTPRNPLTYLNDGTSPVQYKAVSGAVKAICGNPVAICGASFQPTGYPLVNKLMQPRVGNIVAGAVKAICGNPVARANNLITSYSQKTYSIPNDVTKWPYFLYIGGETFPDHASVPSSRRNEFETLCLKICPTQQWIGVLVDYS